MRLRSIFINLLPLILLILVWELIAESQSTRFFLGRPSSIASLAWNEVIWGTLIWDIVITGGQALAGLAIGGILGGVAGFALGFGEALRKVASPYIDGLSVIPPIAFGPMAVLLLGTGFEMKVGFASVAAALAMLAFAFAGSAALDRDLMNAVGSVPHDRRRVWRTVIVPASLGWITAGLRAALAAALVGAFVGQIISSSEGLGHRIQRALGLFDIDGVWVGIIGFACVGLVLSYAIQWGMAILMRHYRHRFGHHQPSGGRTP